MQYGNVQGIKKKISRIVQGSIMLNRSNKEEGFVLLDAAWQAGITTYDSAHGYGGGEVDRMLGLWMEARGNRDEIVIIGKGAHLNQDRNRVTPYDIASDMADSLVRLRSDYIDLYLLHRDDPAVPVGPIVEALNEHHAAGRIHAFGGSNWTPERLAEANEYADKRGLVPFAASSPNFSLADQIAEPWKDCLSIAGPGQAAARAWYAEHDMPLFTWSSVARGFFSGKVTRANAEDKCATNSTAPCPNRTTAKTTSSGSTARGYWLKKRGLSVPQIALSYVLSYPLDIYALVGSMSGDEIAANGQALDNPLSEAEMAWLDLRSEER